MMLRLPRKEACVVDVVKAIGISQALSRNWNKDSMSAGKDRGEHLLKLGETWRLKQDLHPAEYIMRKLREILTAAALTLTRSSHTRTPWGHCPSSGGDSCRSGRGPRWTTCEGCALRERFRRGNTRAGAHPMGDGATCDVLIHLPLICASPRIFFSDITSSSSRLRKVREGGG